MGPSTTSLRQRATTLVALAAAACSASPGESPPPSRSDAGGTSADAGDAGAGADADADASRADAGASNVCGSPGSVSYMTKFLGTENPISEGGVWTNGGVVGLDWQDVQKNNGLGFGTGTSSGYNDNVAHLSGFPPNHYAQAAVHAVNGYDPQSSHEVELLVRFQITAHSARGYEINCGWGGAYSQIVRWNGALSDFTLLNATGPGFGALVEGDVIRATAVGATITATKNGVQVLQVSDSTWSDGDPGMGMFIRPDPSAVLQNYCFSSFSAGSL
jgi:hypothetical protein